MPEIERWGSGFRDRYRKEKVQLFDVDLVGVGNKLMVDKAISNLKDRR